MSFWKKLGKGLKIAAPFAAMAIPGIGPIASMAIGAGMGAGGSLMSGGGLRDAAVSGITGAAGGAAKLPSGGVSGAVKTLTGAAHPSGGWGDLVSTAGTAIDAYGKASAENRGAELSATMDQHQQDISADDSFQRQLLARAQEDRAGQNNAWKQLQQASYVQNRPTAAPTAGFSPYTRAIPMPSDDVVAGAKALTDQNRDSLMSGRFNTNGGAPLPMPTRTNTGIPSNLMRPGTGERIADVAGPALNMWEMLRRKPAPVAA